MQNTVIYNTILINSHQPLIFYEKEDNIWLDEDFHRIESFKN